ncbi:hypothetical protein [Haloferula rosea]|uniref:SLA1 homology domain-containing protein n=1 Tax=Haloferula rosea TaxID=490093 RepID=A0A934RCA0_9BACT|nr:hypothetical protein [Haloferula rosea]MBK1826962.1 hypothetical protein [Haloferula rosea]
MKSAVLPWILALAGVLHAAPPDDVRTWTGKNGRSFRGQLARILDEQVEIISTSGKAYKIGIHNLSEADQRFILEQSSPKNDEDGPAALPTWESSGKFKPHTIDRSKIPIISQGDFGQKASDCVPSAFCNFVLWWDTEGYLEIPKRGDFEDKAEWIHSQMARHCGTRNTSGTSLQEAKEGFTEYFEKRLEDTATLRFKADYDIRPQNLARYTVGANATMLGMSIRRGPRHDSGHWVALISASPDGTIVFHTWGQRFIGKITVLEEDPTDVTIGGQTIPRTSYEIKVQNQEDLPERMKEDSVQFLLIPEQWDGIYTLRPYAFAEEGKPSPPPLDPLMLSEKASR